MNVQGRVLALTESQVDCKHDWKMIQQQQVDLQGGDTFAFWVNIIQVECKKCHLKFLGMTENV